MKEVPHPKPQQEPEIDIKELLFSVPRSEDAFSLILARTQSQRFITDFTKWHKFVYDWQQRTNDHAQELFMDFHFDTEDPENPFCSQLDDHLLGMIDNESFITHKAGTRGLEFTEDARERIKSNPILTRIFSPFYPEMMEIAHDMDRQLGIKKD